MIWWRGRGLWIGFLAGVPAVTAIKLGASNTAIAYASSAALIYLLRQSIDGDGDSSLFSIPTRFWPPLLLLVSLLVQFSPSKPAAGDPAQKSMKSVIAELRASGPRMLNNQIRLERAEYDKGMLQYYATSMVPFDRAGTQQAAFDRQVRKHYCEDLKSLWQSRIGMAIKISVPPRSLSERIESFSITLHPKECQPGSST